MMTEREYIQRLADDAHDTVNLLSSSRKGERERRVCAALLRSLGVGFSPHELTAAESDPPDVIFRDARFEVMIMLDAGRKMHADWKARAEQRDTAKTLEELLEPYHPTAPMTLAEAVDLITADLAQKASHYGSRMCSGLDALVYVNLRERHLDPESRAEVPAGLRSQGWRSVCFIFPPYSGVLLAAPEAPNFLRECERSTRQEWQNADTLFEL